MVQLYVWIIQDIKEAMDAAISATDSKLSKKIEIRAKKVNDVVCGSHVATHLLMCQATVKRLMIVMEALESLERLLNIRRKSSSDEEKSEIEQLAERLVVSLSLRTRRLYTCIVVTLCVSGREEFAAVVMERVASEFNRLQYNVSQTEDHPLVTEITPVRKLA